MDGILEAFVPKLTAFYEDSEDEDAVLSFVFVDIWGTLEAHQGPWGHHKTGILDLGGKNKY